MKDLILKLDSFTPKDLMALIKILRAKYAIYKTSHPDTQDEDIINSYIIISRILSNRSYPFQPSDDILDRESAKFLGYSDSKVNYNHNFGEPYSSVLPSGISSLSADQISLEIINPGLKSFLAASPIAWLVGGIVEQPYVTNDVDILICTPSQEELERIIKFRISRSFPPEMRNRLHLLCEHKGALGPFTNCLPLYRLLVERIPDQEILKMAEVNLRIKDAAKYQSQAEKAIEKNQLTVGEFYLPVKPVRGYYPGKSQTIDLFLDIYDKNYSYPALASKKYDGMRIEIHKNGDKVTIFSEDGSLLERLPKLRDEIKTLKPDKCILEAELERWNYKLGHHLPRETVNPDLEDDSCYTANVFECLLFNGRISKKLYDEILIHDSDKERWRSEYLSTSPESYALTESLVNVEIQTHTLPSLIRFKFLEFLGIKQRTTEAPSDESRINIAPHFLCFSRKELRDKTEELRFLVGSEGNVVSDAAVKYHLTSGTRPYQMLKFHNSVSFIGFALNSIETKTKGIYTIEYGILAGDKPLKFADSSSDDLWINPFLKNPESAFEDPSQPIAYYVGKTFTTTEKVPNGASIEIECEMLNIVRVEDKLAISAWVPRFLGLRENVPPDFLNKIVDEANKYHVAQFKILISKNKTLVDPPDRLIKQLHLADPSNTPLTFYFYHTTGYNWSSTGTWVISAIQPPKVSPYARLSKSASLREVTNFVARLREEERSLEAVMRIAYEKLKSPLSKKEQLDIELEDWKNTLKAAKYWRYWQSTPKKRHPDPEEYAEDNEDVVSAVRTLLKKLTVSANKLASLKNSGRQDLIDEIEKIKSQILSVLLDNNLDRIEVDNLVFSVRKIPVSFEISDEEKLIKSLRTRGLEKFIITHESVLMDDLKDFLLSPEIIDDENFKLPEGIEKKANYFSLYIYSRSSSSSDDNQIASFYETPYDPEKENNRQLADAWRLMCAHYSTWKSTSGKGITFTKDQIVDNATKAVKEIKERISKKEMSHTFEPDKMQDSSKELYELAKKVLTDALKDIGEHLPITEFEGTGSGHFGHAGRPGLIGGSISGSGSSSGQDKSKQSKTANPKSRHKPTKMLTSPNETKVSNLFNTSVEDVRSIIKKEISGKLLTNKEKIILQTGWPDVYGKPGTKSSTLNANLTGEALAMENMNVSMDEVRESVNRLTSGQFLTEKDRLIIQNGWPEAFGKPGEYNISLDNNISASQRDDVLGSLVKSKTIPSKDLQSDARVNKSVISSVLDNIISDITISDDSLLALQAGYPDTFGSPGESFEKSESTEIAISELSAVAKKILHDEELTEYEKIVKNTLQKGFPEIYGKPEFDFTKAKASEIPEDSINQAATILDTSPEVITAYVNEFFDAKATSEEKGVPFTINMMPPTDEDSDINTIKVLQLVYPDIYGAPGTPFHFIDVPEPEAKDYSESPLQDLKSLASSVDGKIKDIYHLPDGSGFTVMSLPLPENHWLTSPGYNEPPMPFQLGTGSPFRPVMENALREAGKYALRASTSNGIDMDLDPDALLTNLIVGMLGYFTPTGLSTEATDLSDASADSKDLSIRSSDIFKNQKGKK